MYKSNQGHGICGAKNNYSSSVKLGNYVEDGFGRDLAANPRHVEKNFISNTMASYPPLDQRPELPPQNAKCPSAIELKTKNKEGMPYSLLFEHGLKPIPSEERFSTVSSSAYKINTESNNAYDISKNALAREKAKQLVQDVNLCYIKTTESRSANAHSSYNPQQAQQTMERNLSDVQLPKWTRVRALTCTIPGFQ